ncbi:flagellar hook-associated protein FlgL [Catenovulum maritimum]|uniref:Flagellin N-terminal domain-containing protein n=1 Tax=Catenovulum maritimum TaxID=1513271 RepID=A0A0J8GYM2_9ALTE|nr:flagellar hook-associated protein FlgL [Catenovulum maritimum]KMT66334.1 hypothetical protein XM47_03605 [Catenovulum maritimum]
MRLTTNMIYGRNLDGILEAQKRLVRAQDTLVKQTNILKPSDDPTGATKVVRFNEDLSRLEQFGRNGVRVENQLTQQEGVLTSINEALNRASTLAIQGGNGALSFSDRRAVANELSLIKEELLDLMNSKNSQGEYLFSGSKSDVIPFVQDSSGQFQYQGDENVKKVQISETLKLETGVPGSGLTLFQDVKARSSLTLDPNSTSTASGSYRLENPDAFDRFQKQNYVQIPPNPAGSNDFSIVLGAGTYQVLDSGGNVIENGNYTAGEPINFKGAEFNISGNAGDQLDFSLDPPNKNNMLNVMDEMILALQANEVPGDDMFDTIKHSIYALQQSQENIGFARSEIGGRLNVLTSVTLSNEDLEINLKEAKAKVSEVDMAEAITELQKQETALTVANQTFGRVTNLSLFNFL